MLINQIDYDSFYYSLACELESNLLDIYDTDNYVSNTTVENIINYYINKYPNDIKPDFLDYFKNFEKRQGYFEGNMLDFILNILEKRLTGMVTD